jgi:hypothetical protein
LLSQVPLRLLTSIIPSALTTTGFMRSLPGMIRRLHMLNVGSGAVNGTMIGAVLVSTMDALFLNTRIGVALFSLGLVGATAMSAG